MTNESEYKNRLLLRLDLPFQAILPFWNES